MARIVIFMTIMLMGCGRSFDFGGAESWTAPNGAVYRHVKCKVDKQVCLDFATSTCAGAYEVIGAESHRGGIFNDTCPGDITWRSLYYRCDPRNGAFPASPVFRFAGPSFAEAIVAHLSRTERIDAAQPVMQSDQLPVSQRRDPDLCSDY